MSDATELNEPDDDASSDEASSSAEGNDADSELLEVKLGSRRAARNEVDGDKLAALVVRKNAHTIVNIAST